MCLAIPAQLVAMVDAEAGLAKAEISGVRRNVSIALCPEAAVGEWVLVHVGFALERIDEEEARRTLELLEQIGEPYRQEVDDIRASCVTCADEAVEARVVEVRGGTAVVERDGRREEVGADLVLPLAPGDVVLCHAGIALEKLPAPEAPGSDATPSPPARLSPPGALARPSPRFERSRENVTGVQRLRVDSATTSPQGGPE